MLVKDVPGSYILVTGAVCLAARLGTKGRVKMPIMKYYRPKRIDLHALNEVDRARYRAMIEPLKTIDEVVDRLNRTNCLFFMAVNLIEEKFGPGSYYKWWEGE